MVRSFEVDTRGIHAGARGILQEVPTGGLHLDLTDADDHVDVSTHTLTLSPGDSVLMAVKPTQLGSADHPRAPGLFASGADAFDDMVTLESDGNGPYTTGTQTATIKAEDSSGNVGESSSFSLTLDEWNAFALAFKSADNDLDYFHNNNGEIGTQTALGGGGTTFTFGAFGYGYGGATNDGSGLVFIDDYMLFSREISASEVTAYYNNGTIPSPGPDHHWKFDDDSVGGTATDSVGTADGTINGGTYVSGNAFI